MPQKLKETNEVIIHIFKQYAENLFNKETESIKKCTDPIWISISQEFMKKNMSISAKYAYVLVSQNRYNLQEHLGFTARLSLSSPNHNSSSHDSGEGTDANIQKFQIVLTPQEYSSLQDTALYARKNEQGASIREYTVLTPHCWTDIIYDKFHSITRLPCAISFKRNKIHPQGSVFLTITGQCTDCLSVFEGKIYSLPDLEINDPIVIECTYSGDFHQCAATSKRKMFGLRKRKFVEEMIKENKSAAYIRTSFAKKKMAFGEAEPSHCPTGNALRVLKSREIKNRLLHDDPITALCILKGEGPYNNIIQDIAIDHFNIKYWSTSEINNYRTLCKYTKVPTLCVDATGDVVRKIDLISGRKTSHIFLYELVAYDKKNRQQFSVAHMLSEKHDNITIAHWLNEWLRVGVPNPKIIVMDKSLALMHATTRAFTQYSTLPTYLSICFKLIHNEDVEVPHCMLRNDINHTMHLISMWVPFKTSVHPRFKNFYMHAIALLVSNIDYKDVLYLVRQIFAVSLFTTEGLMSNGEENPCEIAKRYLTQRIAGHEIAVEDFEEMSDISASIDDDGTIEDYTTPSSFYTEIEIIYNEVSKQALKDDEGDHGNLHYNVDIAKKLLSLCKLIPCWSGIMVPIFKYGDPTETSTYVENTFGYIRNQVFKHLKLPIRVDKFVKKHINSNLGASRLTRSVKAYRDTNQNTDYQEVSEESCGSDIDDPQGSDYSSHEEDTHSYKVIIQPKKIKLHHSTQISKKLIKPSENSSGDPESEKSQNENENWRGKGISVKQKKKTYLHHDPSIAQQNISSGTQSRVIGILKNGNHLSLKNIEINRKYYTFMNTCPFDVLVQILCIAYTDSLIYKNFVDSKKNDFLFFELVSHLLRDGVNVQSYRKRGQILISLKQAGNKLLYPAKPANARNHYILHIETVISYLMKALFKNYPSVIEKKICNTCSAMSSENRTTIIAHFNSSTANESIIRNAIITGMVNQGKHIERCKSVSCQSEDIIIEREAQDHILIECETLGEDEENNDYKNFDLMTTISEIPQVIEVNNSTYRLRGIVHFISPSGGMGHYIAHCYRPNAKKWETYDDLCNTVRHERYTYVNKAIIRIPILIYTK